MNDIQIIKADLENSVDQDAVLKMMDAYASDPMGDGRPLSHYAKTHLIDGLRKHPTTLIVIAMQGDSAVGIAACFGGFSTFSAKPLLHVSDYFVLPTHQGKGIGRSLMERVEQEARSADCCKITLEVQENNRRARSVYKAFGFSQAVYVEAAGGSLTMSKPLK